MGINVWTTMGFENRNFQGGTAQKSEHKGAVTEENSVQISQSAKTYVHAEGVKTDLGIYMPVSQFTQTASLKETLKYLQAHAKDKRKRYILGELWESLGDYEGEDDYSGELVDFEINFGLKNIFAA